MVRAFANIEGPLEGGVALGVFLDRRDTQMLGEVDRLVPMVLLGETRNTILSTFSFPASSLSGTVT